MPPGLNSRSKGGRDDSSAVGECKAPFPQPDLVTQPRPLVGPPKSGTLTCVAHPLLRHTLRSGLGALAVLSLALPAWSGEQEDVFWSFRPLCEQPLPSVKDPTWPQTRLDHFILAELEQAGLSPAPPADERSLRRRLSFDLLGLPPESGDETLSWPELVDRYLASPHYGERWGRHWLDLARYADITESWSETKSPSWLYRDWVVAALNRDLPYDRFIIHQLANDLLPGARPEDNAALGFLGIGPTYWKELKLPPEIIGVTVAEEWEERMDAVGRTFLGLTLACARCHDHKSDPVTAEDYYALAGVFASVRAADRPVLPEAEWEPVRQARERVADLEAKIQSLKKTKPAPSDLKAKIAELEKEIARLQAETPRYHVATAPAVVEAALFVEAEDGDEYGTKLEYIPGMARDLPLHRRGDPNSPGEIVPRRFLSAFPRPDGKPRPLTQGSGRLELAQAIVDEAAPLSARVIVNRIWMQHFGRGLVPTPSEFGPSGELPSHPALLDDLAARFVASGWSLKWLHREILLSATWQQSSLVSSELAAKDPQGQLYSHRQRRRLDVESWRDAMLVASGELDLSLGGPPFDLDEPNATRRTLYGRVKRRELDAMLQVNDFPAPVSHSPARTETATPLQQLFSLNGPFVLARAQRLAERLAQSASEDARRIDLAYEWLLQRPPTAAERQLGLAYLDEGGNWERYAQVLLTSNEFLYLD